MQTEAYQEVEPLMKTTYERGIEQGIEQGERRLTLRLMRAKFGPLSAKVEEQVVKFAGKWHPFFRTIWHLACNRRSGCLARIMEGVVFKRVVSPVLWIGLRRFCPTCEVILERLAALFNRLPRAGLTCLLGRGIID